MNKNFDSIDIFFIVMILIYFTVLIMFITVFLVNYFKDEEEIVEKKVKNKEKKFNINFDKYLSALKMKKLVPEIKKVKEDVMVDKKKVEKPNTKKIDKKTSTHTSVKNKKQKSSQNNKVITNKKTSTKINNAKKNTTKNTKKKTSNVKNTNIKKKNYKNNVSYVKNNPKKK